MEVFGGDDEEGYQPQRKQHREVSDKEGFLCLLVNVGQSVLPVRFENQP